MLHCKKPVATQMKKSDGFGSAIRDLWLLDPGVRYLNHGSYGATPRQVLAAQQQWRDRMERQPVAFMSETLPRALREAAARLAAFVGAEARDLVFVENATAAANAVLASTDLAPGDEIVVTTHGYPAVRKAVRHRCAQTGARMVEAALRCPIPNDANVVGIVESTLGPRVRLAILDHITSTTATMLPIKRLVALCRERGVPVLVDGAHAPGMLALDVAGIGADYYTGNCHKWLFAPKGCGFLWARPEAQPDLHPTVISHGYGQGFTAEFDWIGTRDPSTWLAVTEAIGFLQQLGPERLRRRNTELCRAAADMLCEAWQTECAAPPGMRAAMATIRLPGTAGPGTRTAARQLHAWLRDTRRIEVPIHVFADALWVRVSAQVYNTLEEYEALAEAIAEFDPARDGATPSPTAAPWA